MPTIFVHIHLTNTQIRYSKCHKSIFNIFIVTIGVAVTLIPLLLLSHITQIQMNTICVRSFIWTFNILLLVRYAYINARKITERSQMPYHTYIDLTPMHSMLYVYIIIIMMLEKHSTFTIAHIFAIKTHNNSMKIYNFRKLPNSLYIMHAQVHHCIQSLILYGRERRCCVLHYCIS